MLKPKSADISFLILPDANSANTCFWRGLKRATRRVHFFGLKFIARKCRNSNTETIDFSKDTALSNRQLTFGSTQFSNMGFDKGTSFRRPIQGFERREPVQETVLKGQVIQIERKVISLLRKKNALGEFLRITEEVGGKRNSVIIPATGFAEFKKIVNEMIETPGV